MYDYHIHSNFSYDHRGGSSIEEITLAAIALGLKEIALTDHFDPNFPADQADLDFPEYKRELLRVKELYKTKIRLVPGIELGLRVGDTISSCAREIASWQYEFVIASVHSAGEHPIHMPAYREERSTIDAVLFYYETVLDCIKSFDNFDVLGHVNVIERYLP
jgi:histidinol-phosphatase (PHP family)